MSAPGRPKRELFPLGGMARSAKGDMSAAGTVADDLRRWALASIPDTPATVEMRALCLAPDAIVQPCGEGLFVTTRERATAGVWGDADPAAVVATIGTLRFEGELLDCRGVGGARRAAARRLAHRARGDLHRGRGGSGHARTARSAARRAAVAAGSAARATRLARGRTRRRAPRDAGLRRLGRPCAGELRLCRLGDGAARRSLRRHARALAPPRLRSRCRAGRDRRARGARQDSGVGRDRVERGVPGARAGAGLHPPRRDAAGGFAAGLAPGGWGREARAQGRADALRAPRSAHGARTSRTSRAC